MKALPLTLPVALFLMSVGCSYESAYAPYDSPQEPIDVSDDTSPPRTNPWVTTTTDPISTFSADVDTASYSLTRRALRQGDDLDIDTIRVEEFLNYFRYDTAGPTDDLPFAATLEVGPSVFGSDDTALLRIAVQAEEIPLADRAPVNLVFLMDVSGSMRRPDKLGLAKYAMTQLVDKLRPDDTLSIVTYAGSDRVVLEPTAVEQKSVILDALDDLEAGGSTNGEAGIRQAYALARSAYRDDGVNRVVLCSDGDMNVGLSGQALVDEVTLQRDRGIFLTTLGFGDDNFQDATMEQLANDADGNYAYLDTRNEALRVLGENLVSTLQVVAKDTKLQVTFDPERVRRWRLIGYENRVLADGDFENDAVDAGDIGAGHHVTALYELELYPDRTGPLADLDIRYKEPMASESTLHSWTVDGASHTALADTSADFQFAAAVAEFAEILRESEYSEGERYDEISAMVSASRPAAVRTPVETELLQLIELAANR